MLSLANQAAGVNVALFLSCGINSVVLRCHWRSYSECFFRLWTKLSVSCAHWENARRSSWQRCRRLTLQSAFIFWPTILLYDLNAKSFFSMRRTELLAIPVICSISRGLLRVPGASSWLQIRSSTWLMLTDVFADLGRPLPIFHSALALASIRLSKLSSPLLDHSLDGNPFNSIFESHLFSFFQVFN